MMRWSEEDFNVFLLSVDLAEHHRKKLILPKQQFSNKFFKFLILEKSFKNLKMSQRPFLELSQTEPTR